MKKNRSILVVEDAVSTADILGMFFDASGYSVRVAYDGQQAVNQALIDPPDVIVMDLGLPEMNGLEAAKKIQRNSKDKVIRFIAVSGFDDHEMVRRCYDQGFDAHVAKPPDPKALLKIVESLFKDDED